jgi:hypothetical protein
MQKMWQIREGGTVTAFCANLNKKALSLFGYSTRPNATSASFTLTGRISRYLRQLRSEIDAYRK